MNQRTKTPLGIALFQDPRFNYEIAAAVDLDPAELSRYANGLHPSEATWQKLAKELNRNVEDIRHPATPQTPKNLAA